MLILIMLPCAEAVRVIAYNVTAFAHLVVCYGIEGGDVSMSGSAGLVAALVADAVMLVSLNDQSKVVLTLAVLGRADGADLPVRFFAVVPAGHILYVDSHLVYRTAGALVPVVVTIAIGSEAVIVSMSDYCNVVIIAIKVYIVFAKRTCGSGGRADK